MSNLTANQRRFLTALTLSTIAVLAYLLALVPGAASADVRDPATPAPASAPAVHLLEIHADAGISR